eukprot:scaffold132161_cov30-Tisochrysis_lutea.AAC.1
MKESPSDDSSESSKPHRRIAHKAEVGAALVALRPGRLTPVATPAAAALHAAFGTTTGEQQRRARRHCAWRSRRLPFPQRRPVRLHPSTVIAADVAVIEPRKGLNLAQYALRLGRQLMRLLLSAHKEGHNLDSVLPSIKPVARLEDRAHRAPKRAEANDRSLDRWIEHRWPRPRDDALHPLGEHWACGGGGHEGGGGGRRSSAIEQCL